MNDSSGIITRRYKHGSIVYFENDKSEYIYILKGGRVVLTSRKVDTGEEVKEEVKAGEFFGVKSSLGRYPREETAQTIGETVLLVLTLAEFERLVLKNVNVVRKMLRIFSNQLRRINKVVRDVLGEGEDVNPAQELFKIGEYYYRIGKVQQAIYAYKRYMEYYPDGEYSGKSMQRIQAIESGSQGGEFDTSMEDDDMPAMPGPAEQPDDSMDLTDFSIEGEEAAAPQESDDLNDFEGGDSTASPLADEMDDFFSDDDSSNVDDVSFEEPESGPKEQDINGIFYEAMSKFSQEDYNGALDLYLKILDVKNLKDDAEGKTFEKAHFEIGRCYIKLSKFNEALQALSNMIKKFPKSDDIKNALLHIGIIYESVNKQDKALTYYNKVASMEPKDSVSKIAVKKLKQLQES